MAIRARSTNTLLQHDCYPIILEEYNAQFRSTGGRVNAKKFWETYIAPRIPSYPLPTWYNFLRRFKSDSLGIINISGITKSGDSKPPDGEIELHQNILSNEQATATGIAHALNLGAAFYKTLWDKYLKDPESLNSFEKRAMLDALHRAMKSQDSRIHALGKVREDRREQEKFERAFRGAAYTPEEEIP